MKNGYKTRRTVIMILAAVMIFTTFVTAQSKDQAMVTFNKATIENLKSGIGSDNAGVRRSAIYFAGKYQLNQLSGSLVRQFSREENTGMKILIALSLYQMNDIDALSKLKDLVSRQPVGSVRIRVQQIWNQLQSDRQAANLQARL